MQQELLEKREEELKRETEAVKSCQKELNRKIEEVLVLYVLYMYMHVLPMVFQYYYHYVFIVLCVCL